METFIKTNRRTDKLVIKLLEYFICLNNNHKNDHHHHHPNANLNVFVLIIVL